MSIKGHLVGLTFQCQVEFCKYFFNHNVELWSCIYVYFLFFIYLSCDQVVHGQEHHKRVCWPLWRCGMVSVCDRHLSKGKLDMGREYNVDGPLTRFSICEYHYSMCLQRIQLIAWDGFMFGLLMLWIFRNFHDFGALPYGFSFVIIEG